MFDNALPKARRTFAFGDISVAIRLVDDDPGAVQVWVVSCVRVWWVGARV